MGDDRIYEEVLAIVLETMESKFGVFGFLADNGDLVIPTMSREIWADCQVPGKSMVFPPATWGDSLWGRALQERKVFRSNGPFHTPPGHIPIDSFLTTPIVFGNRTIGLLSVANRTGGYTAADQDLLQSIADYFSPVLNARLERDRQEQERKEAERRLRESEAKYRELFENAREAIVIFNLEKTITDVNKFVETYGFRQEDLIGRNYIEFVAEPYREKAIEDFELLRQGLPLEGEFEVMTPKGQVTVYYKDSPIVRGGAVVGVQSILMDVTQRRRAEEALRKSEARYRLLANHASDIIWTTDLNLQLTYCSPSVERILGYTLEEALARKADEDLTPASRALVQQTLAEEMEIERTGQGDPLRSRVIEVEEIRKDGTTLWAEIRAGFLRDANGAALGIVGVTRDISDRRKLEREIVVREKYLNSFFTGATAGLALLDKDLRYVQINDTLAEMNGMPAQDHLGRTIREVLPRLAPMVEPIFRKVLATGAAGPERGGCRPNEEGFRRPAALGGVVLPDCGRGRDPGSRRGHRGGNHRAQEDRTTASGVPGQAPGAGGGTDAGRGTGEATHRRGSPRPDRAAVGSGQAHAAIPAGVHRREQTPHGPWKASARTSTRSSKTPIR